MISKNDTSYNRGEWGLSGESQLQKNPGGRNPKKLKNL
jgi:hypothetical protein